MSLITVQEVTTEYVKKGKGGYTAATVVYSDNGKNFTKKIMSFANPAVFDVIKDAKQGEQYDVTVTKDGEYYNWSSITKSDTPPMAKAAVGGGKVTGSNYETADERKVKQLYIIKQSSIANAIEFIKLTEGAAPEVTDVLDIAQQFVDFVYGTNENLDTVDTAD